MDEKTLSTADELAIHALMSLYGHVIDERDWSRMPDLFTDDVIYDMTDFNLGRLQGIAAVRQLWIDQEGQHPLAHHATNVIVTAESVNTARVVSKGIGIGRGGRVGSVVYRDTVRRSATGWRIAERVGQLRRPPGGL